MLTIMIYRISILFIFLANMLKAQQSPVLLPTQDRNVAQIYQFIEKGLEKGECVLVHSRDGTCMRRWGAAHGQSHSFNYSFRL